MKKDEPYLHRSEELEEQFQEVQRLQQEQQILLNHYKYDK